MSGLEKPLAVAFLGPAGTYTQAAVFKHFGHAVHALPLASIDEVFHQVQATTADFGVVPVENSSEGTVNNTLDRFMTTEVMICGEIELKVEHSLVGRMADLGQVQRVCAHAQALGQCRGWLEKNLNGIEFVAVSSNGEGARRARDELGTAAIASEVAAEIYELKVLVPRIEDHEDNTTRFLVLGTSALPASGADKTTLLLSANATAESGALFRLLEPLARHKVSMSRIESRPSRRKKWDYVFFIDLDGHVTDTSVAAALEELQQRASLFRVLGSYPKATQ
ncbi:MAG: prephenate dehydratase [Pseudomonadota bacterium]